MISIYARTNQTLHVETTFDVIHKEFRLVIRRFDGTEHVETFADAGTFQARLGSLERQLVAESWQHNNSVPISDGWKL